MRAAALVIWTALVAVLGWAGGDYLSRRDDFRFDR